MADGSLLRVALPFAHAGLLPELLLPALRAALPAASFLRLHSVLLSALGKTYTKLSVPPHPASTLDPRLL